MTIREASIAARRFGLGPRPGDLRRIAADPRGYVAGQLKSPTAARLQEPGLVPSHVAFAELQNAQFAQQIAQQMARQMAEAASGKASAGPMVPTLPSPGQVRRDIFQEEAVARIAHAVTTGQPFVERLVMFWSNHLAISALKGGGVRVMAGAFEREAIRPHVLGRFADMLKAAEQHPAMLLYLDNTQSIGPNSQAGFNRNRGLNENLAREILELHTLGVDGGYSQADVTSFAKVLTGWGATDTRMVIAMQSRGQSVVIAPGQFAFMPQRHEPGEQTVLGNRYPDHGLATGEAVLADLAKHPATARHVARKLAAHFVSQAPPPALIERLARTFRDTDGDLLSVSKALAASPECWQAAPAKIVPPYDFTVALMRAFDLDQRRVEALRVAAAIGQPLWQPPSPKGWPDDDDAWMGPAAVRERLRIAERVARDIPASLDPRAAAADLLGDAMSPQTRAAIDRAEAREQGFELLVMSPEFLRR